MRFNFFSIFNCEQPNSPPYSEHPIPAQPIAYITRHPIIRHDVSFAQKASNLPHPLALRSTLEHLFLHTAQRLMHHCTAVRVVPHVFAIVFQLWT